MGGSWYVQSRLAALVFVAGLLQRCSLCANIMDHPSSD